MTFLTVVGITPDELAAMKTATTAAILERMGATNSLLVTDPAR